MRRRAEAGRSDVTRTPVSTRPPNDSSARTSASVIAPEPPFATAQPAWWQAHVSAIPTAELIGRLSGLKACAATPPKSAFACSVLNMRTSAVAGIAARRPKPARRIGCFGRCSIGWKKSSASASNAARRRPEHAPPARTVLPQARGRRVDRLQQHCPRCHRRADGRGRSRASATRGRIAPAPATAGTATRPPSDASPSRRRAAAPGRSAPPSARRRRSCPRPRAPSRRRPRARARPRRPGRWARSRRLSRCSRDRRGLRPALAPSRDLDREVEALLEPGPALDHVTHVDPALLDQPGRGVVDAVLLLLDVRRL